MKKLLLIVFGLISFASHAYDFEVDGIYYNVLSLSDLTCEVTYNAENEKSGYLGFYESRGGSRGTSGLSRTYPSYKGEVIIPATVNYKGRELKVTGIGDYAFLNCSELTSLSLPSSITNISEVLVSANFDCYAGAFDYCNIKTFSAGNAYSLQMFDQSYASKSGCKTKDNLENIILSNDFEGTIGVDFSNYKNLVSITSNCAIVPLFANGSHFSNNQFLNVLVRVKNAALNSYRASNVWLSF